MKREQILELPSMPAASPSYPCGPYRFVQREYLIVVYESDEGAIREAVPEPLEPAPGGVVYYEFIRMPDSSGFGDYTESGIVIPCTYEGQGLEDFQSSPVSGSKHHSAASKRANPIRSYCDDPRN